MSIAAPLPAPPERILSTLNPDGSRRWLRPRVSRGRFLLARRIAAWALIAIFALIPHLRIGGRPAILLDIGRREFTLFGKLFLPTDTILLAILLVATVVAIFFITAVLGRIWCGWACPQTVYMEFVYRPIERLFEGPPGRGGAAGRKMTALRTAGKYAAFTVVSLLLAHTFLAYFVGTDALRVWMARSPFEHPTSFAVMAVTAGLMLLDFAWFREQTCIVACPYGRLQSVLIDRDSLIVSYDPRRGEPRGVPGGTGESKGDCIDCSMCVETCPTGIDIRDGLRMECIGCAQCIDACDVVMDRLKRPRGLVRYSSQSRIAGEPGRLARPRVFVYPAVLLVLGTVFSILLAGKKEADVTLLRGLGVPFTVLPGGEVSNPARLKITNRSRGPRAYRIEIIAGAPARIVLDEDPIRVPADSSVTKGMLIAAPGTSFAGGKHEVRLRIADGEGFSTEVSYRLLGPSDGATGGPAGKGSGDGAK